MYPQWHKLIRYLFVYSGFFSDCLHKRQGVQNAGFWYYQTKQNKAEESTSQMEMRKALLTQS